MTDTERGQLMTAEQLAERWQITPAHVYRLTRGGDIPAVRVGRYYRYRIDQIERYENGEIATLNGTH